MEDFEYKDEAFGAVLNCAVRYALGRRTYMPSLVISYITPILPKISTQTLLVISHDIYQHRLNFGDHCDEEDWLAFRENVKVELLKRGEELCKDWRTDE